MSQYPYNPGFPGQQAPAYTPPAAPQAPAYAPQGFPAQAPQQAPAYAPQAPAYAPQGFPAQAPQQAPAYAPQGFPGQQAGGMGWQPQPGYPAAAAPAPQGPPPAQGTLDAFNSQPTGSRPPGLTWKGIEPGQPGSVFTGTVTADVTDRDVSQDTDPQTKQLKFYRDGRPMFHMAVTLQLDPGTYNEATYTNGLATMYVRGRMSDALSAGMQQAGVSGAPKAGDRLSVALVERRPGRGTIPANIYTVAYQPGAGWQGQQAMPEAPQAVAQPVAMPEAPQAVAQPVAMPEAPQAPAYTPPVAMPQAQAPAQPVAAAPQAQAMSAEQAALLARIQGGQA